MNNEPVKAEAPEPEASVSASAEAEAVETRDYAAEAAELIKNHPEVAEDYMTEETFNMLVSSGKPLAAAFEEYQSNKMKQEFTQAKKDIEDLKKENEILKQNLEAAQKAPVTSVSEGGSTESPFAGNPILAGLFGE